MTALFSQVYPTILRSVGLGACSGMARTGAVLTPYVAQVLMKANMGAAVGVYVVAALGAAVVWEDYINAAVLPRHLALTKSWRKWIENSKSHFPISQQH